ncbi:MAG: helix-turn-helix transcriptional regulator [Clostridia bacterium]|nr:helix-turn-helix transcriptional regulator [Clostridia bacterium]
MWNERIIEAKKAQGITPKMMSERTRGHLPERTIVRILSGETPNPRIDTIIELGAAVGLTPQELFADTNAIAATETLAEVKETAEVVEAEKDLALAELVMLRAKAAAQETEIALLKEKLQHKEELLAVYNYFTKIKPVE